MELLPLLRRSLLGLLGAGVGLSLAAAVARADELSVRQDASGLVVHGPEETLRDFCREEDGALWLVLPGGARFELVTTTSDPAISNPGDGSFHPFEEAVVRAALASVRYPLAGISTRVFLLPYPRRHGLRSATGAGVVLLSPGVWPLAVERQHAEVVHELGHAVQHAHLPDAAAGLWSRYRDLRSIADVERFRADAAHADRPHEIFAEDFRVLFGGALANYSGTIENATLPPPASVPGLREFVLELAGGSLQVAGPVVGYPNPSRGAVSFRRAGGEARLLELFDLAGRRIAALEPTPAGGAWSWGWDGRDAGGRLARPGLVLARLRGEAEPATRIVVAR